MNKLQSAVIIATLLLSVASAQAQVGALQGVVSGAQPGAVLGVFKGDEKVADIKVEAGGKYSVALNTGVYTVKCPNGKTSKIAALNGAANVNINCQ